MSYLAKALEHEEVVKFDKQQKLLAEYDAIIQGQKGIVEQLNNNNSET